MERWTITVPDDVAAQVQSQLAHGDSRSQWVVDAIEDKLQHDIETERHARAGAGALDDRPVTLPDDLPTTVDEAAARTAIAAVLDYLESHGSATKADLVAEIMPNHPLGYDVPEPDSGRYRGAWWRRVIKPALKATPAVEPPQPGGSDWRWVG